MPSNFWMMINNEENFRITQARGFTLLGLKAQHRRKVQRITEGDRVLLYISHLRRFAATATAMSSYYEAEDQIWVNEGSTGFPYHIKLKPGVILKDDQFIDANLLAPRLEYVKRWNPEDWYMAFQGNLHLLPKNDFTLIEEEMKKLHFGKGYVPADFTPAVNNQRRRRSGGRRNRQPESAERLPAQPAQNPQPTQTN
ncbi:MAG: EVE domain-containing protein [Chloroflexi bacterium]|nr:EVE domain-containing protein [Chloroflexota bacterium]MCH8800624.1 EVE domain-containing protein [Chloroflexota bacterium]MCH8892355.1 EVE domain-containing protein [Chloroflexota bacterium]MCI0800378.1 EVE domain-containing protein [Chloroflexota bacterium]MCI0811176.1 EVE domain-containing protein [Chloroflexota bacterium]